MAATDSFAVIDSMGSLYVIPNSPRKKKTVKPPVVKWDKNLNAGDLESLKKLDEIQDKLKEEEEDYPALQQQDKSCDKINLNEFLGLFYALLSAFAMAAMSLCAKMPTSANAVQISLFRGMLQYIILLPGIQYNKLQLWGPRLAMLKYLLLRGAMGTFSSLCFIASISLLPLGDAIAISYSYAVIVGLLSCVCLKEKCTVLDVVFTIVTIVGVVLIARPSFMFPSNDNDFESGTRIIGVSLAFGGSILVSVAYIVVRKMGTEVHVMLSLFYYSWEGAVISFLYLVFTQDSAIPCLSDIPYIVGIAVLGLLGQVLTTMALQREKAGPVTLIHTTQIIMGFLLQYFVLGVVPYASSAIGASLILISTGSLTIRKIVAVKNRKS